MTTRRDSHDRAEAAFQLHSIGRTWQEISAELGFRSRQAAQQAVKRLHARQPSASPDTVRRSAAESLRILRSVLFDRFAVAKQNGDDQTLIALHRELTRNLSEAAKLHGAYAPERTEVDVNVRQTPAAIIDRMETELLALARANNTNIIEGEVVG